MKRIVLFLLTNIAVMVVLSLTASLLGVNRFITANGMNFTALLGFASVFGFGGAFISLFMSKWMAKMSTGAQVIDTPRNPTETWLMNTVQRQAMAAGIPMPEVAVYDSPEVNAFATGPSKSNSLVAVSTGLLYNMTEDEVEAVLAHEISHVANGDMVTLTLIQGVVNTFVIAISKVVAFAVDRALSSNNNEESNKAPGMAYYITSMVCEILLGFLASIIVMWFSRQREFRADAGAAGIAGRQKMIAALERLRAQHQPAQLPSQMQAMGINGGFRSLFSSHPSLEDRIAALRSAP
ncbi:protease HtpX [Crenobacter sp. SG2303]|uniref:Protease HtpX homolog n=1 Tax=Crenobacter oryzisoli TaxID=3056844 RepID=A0ABT7XKN1_9NEIS|nr:protease HtpX [Crenobacter sp. SG2303]MDN0074300.1 protease HtpX [Crenobacter sp. SG2303]